MQGLIQPLIPAGSQAAVFAVYNDRKQLQYVGFSKDLYNSLRTLLGRRPDKAFFYKWVPGIVIVPVYTHVALHVSALLTHICLVMLLHF